MTIGFIIILLWGNGIVFNSLVKQSLCKDIIVGYNNEK